MSLADNKRIVQEFLDETYNKGNMKNTDRFVTPDFVYHARGEDIEGIESYNEWVSSDRSIFPDIKITVVDSIAESGKVASAFIVCWTQGCMVVVFQLNVRVTFCAGARVTFSSVPMIPKTASVMFSYVTVTLKVSMNDPWFSATTVMLTISPTYA